MSRHLRRIKKQYGSLAAKLKNASEARNNKLTPEQLHEEFKEKLQDPDSGKLWREWATRRGASPTTYKELEGI